MRRAKAISQFSKNLRLGMKAASGIAALAWQSRRIAPKLDNGAGRVVDVLDFGSNPGELRMLVYRPVRLRKTAPLIVVMHGCGQDAEAFARTAGWIDLAERLGLALVLPEQRTKNNHTRCFNWHRPSDAKRGSGEAMSVRQMVQTALKRFSADRRQVFIVGLSAGGAMAAALLAAYPAVFAAGAVAAGMPVGAATNIPAALFRMRHANNFQSGSYLAGEVRRSSPQRVRETWPRISIWQGADDTVIDPQNAEVLALQWRAIHGLEDSAFEDLEPATGVRCRRWGTAKRVMVEFWTIAGMGHGFPIDASLGGGCRASYGVVDAGVPAAVLITRFWGIDR